MYSCISCDFVKKYDLKVAVGACNLQTHVPQTCTVNRKNTKSVLLYNPAWRGVVFGACMVRRLVQAWNPWPCTLGITTLVAICAPTHPCNFGLGSSWWSLILPSCKSIRAHLRHCCWHQISGAGHFSEWHHSVWQLSPRGTMYTGWVFAHFLGCSVKLYSCQYWHWRGGGLDQGQILGDKRREQVPCCAA